MTTQSFWIILYAAAGIGLLLGVGFYAWTQIKLTFLMPPVDGTVVFYEKYRLVKNPGMVFANRAHIVLTEQSLVISIYKMLYTYDRRDGANTCFTYPLTSVTQIEASDEPKFNVELDLPNGNTSWKLSLSEPANFIRVATHDRDLK